MYIAQINDLRGPKLHGGVERRVVEETAVREELFAERDRRQQRRERIGAARHGTERIGIALGPVAAHGDLAGLQIHDEEGQVSRVLHHAVEVHAALHACAEPACIEEALLEVQPAEEAA